MYNLTEEQLKVNTNIFDFLKDNFDNDSLNNKLFLSYKDKSFYTKFLNTHMINDYFTKEKTKLTINKKFLLIRTNEEIPLFFKDIDKNEKNIFVCDFLNRDYFWLEELV